MNKEVLDKLYLSANDVKQLIPTLSIDKCRKLIDESREEMKQKKYFVPQSKPRLALTKIVKKKLGI